MLTPAWRINFNAVGGKKTLRTSCSATNCAAHSGSKARAGGSQDRLAVEQGEQKHVDETPDPGPVRRRPEDVAVGREAVVREAEARLMPQQRPMGEERTFRRTRRPGRVDQERRIVCGGVCHLQAGRGIVEQIPEASIRIRGIAGHDHMRRADIAAHLGDGLESSRVADDHSCAAVAEPVCERVRTEEHAQGNGDRTALVGAEMRDARLHRLREHDRDAVARADTEPAQRVGEAVGELGKLPERISPGGAVFGDAHEGGRVRHLLVGTRRPDVEATR